MVDQANNTFTYLNGLRVDYVSFYRDVTGYISSRYNMQIAEREESMLSLSILVKNHENAVLNAIDRVKYIGHAKKEPEKAKEKKESLDR